MNNDNSLKMENRFIIEFPTTFEIPTWSVSNITLPAYTLNVGWEPITIEVIDTPVKQTTKVVYDKIVNPMIEGTLGNNILTIEIINNVGEVLDKWLISGKFTKVKFGQGNYNSEEPIKTTITFQPDNCKLVDN